MWSRGDFLPTDVKSLFDRHEGDRGVSPVVGMVLLLGVTVVLGLVIGPFVLGTLSDLESDTPDADFAFLYEQSEKFDLTTPTDDFGTSLNEGDGLLTIQLEQGENLDPANIEVRGDTSGGNLLNDTGADVFAADSRLQKGDTITLTAERNETVEVIWTADDSEEGAVIGEFTIEVPDTLIQAGVPEPDADCDDDYVENQVPGDVVIDGVIVECDIDQYDIDDIDMRNDGGVIGNVEGKGDIYLENSGVWEGFFISGSDGSDGDVDLSNSTVETDIEAKGDGNVDLFNGSNVGGDIMANGATDLDGNSSVDGAIDAGNDPSSNGDVTITGNSAVSDGIVTPGTVDVDDNSTVGGSITADDRVALDTVTVQGAVDAGQDVDIDDTTVGGSVRTDGNLDVVGSTIRGDVSAGGNVGLVDTVVEGDVDAGGDFTCTNSIINGKTCDEYRSPEYQISIDSTNSPVEKGNSISVTATVNNTGIDGQGEVRLEVDGDVAERKQLSVSDTSQVQFNWPTGSVSPGRYNATVISDADANSTELTVMRDDVPYFDPTIDSHEDNVSEGETLNVTATIDNVGQRSDTQAVTLQDFDGNVVDSQSVTVSDQGSEQVTLRWQTLAGDAGEGNVTVVTENASAGQKVQIESRTYNIVDVALFPGSGNEIAVVVTVDTNDPDAELFIESVESSGAVRDFTRVPASTGDYYVDGANQADEIRVTLLDSADLPRDQVTENWYG